MLRSRVESVMKDCENSCTVTACGGADRATILLHFNKQRLLQLLPMFKLVTVELPATFDLLGLFFRNVGSFFIPWHFILNSSCVCGDDVTS